MATWVKAFDNRYFNISQIKIARVQKWFIDPNQDPDSPADDNWWIWADGQAIRGQTPTSGWGTQAAAQTFLDTAISNLGGSV